MSESESDLGKRDRPETVISLWRTFPKLVFVGITHFAATISAEEARRERELQS